MGIDATVVNPPGHREEQVNDIVRQLHAGHGVVGVPESVAVRLDETHDRVSSILPRLWRDEQ